MAEDRDRPAANPPPRSSQGVTFVVLSALILIAAVAFTAMRTDQPLEPILLVIGEWTPCVRGIVRESPRSGVVE